MKKIMIVFMSLLLLSVLSAGCGGSSSGTQNQQSGKDTQQSQGNAASSSSGEQGYPEMTVRFSHVAAEDTPKGMAANKFKEVVEQKSGGKIKVDVFPSGQLYGDNDEIEALQANNVQFIAPSVAKLAGFDKSFELFDLPFMFKNEDHLIRFEDGEGGKLLLSKAEKGGMVGLAFWPNGFKHITNSKVPIRKPQDLKGLKIRTHGGEIINDFYAQLGAASTQIAFNDVYQALQLGTVDGQENSLVNIETQKYEEVQKYLTLTNHARSEYIVVTNKQWWDGLDEKTKQLFMEAMAEATKVGREMTLKLEKEALDKIKQHGKMEIIQLSDQERQAFVDAVKPVFDKWSKEVDPAVIKAVQEAAK